MRIAVALGWVALCVYSAARVVGHTEVAPLTFTPEARCAPYLDATFARLRPMLPEEGAVGFVGPETYSGCSPLMALQYSIAPVWVAPTGDRSLRDDLLDRDEVFATEPAVVVAMGSEGRAWLRDHSGWEVIARLPQDIVLLAEVP